MIKTILLTALILLTAAPAFPQSANPYLPLWEHLPDGEPRVFEDPTIPANTAFTLLARTTHDSAVIAALTYAYGRHLLMTWPTGATTDPVFTYQIGGQWDVMYAPDLVEVKRRDGTKEYYLYPHSRGHRREAMVARGTRPDGPFTPINLTADGTATLPGSILGFDPSVYIEYVTDPADPDYETGFRAYGYWGFQRSLAAQLDPNTMYSVRSGTEVIPYFMPSSSRYGDIRDPRNPIPAHLSR